MAQETKLAKRLLPEQGVELTASPGNKITRVHLDLAADGITLAMVGAAAAASSFKAGNRHRLTLSPAKEGVTLAMVGAATAAK